MICTTICGAASPCRRLRQRPYARKHDSDEVYTLIRPCSASCRDNRNFGIQCEYEEKIESGIMRHYQDDNQDNRVGCCLIIETIMVEEDVGIWILYVGRN